VVRESVTLVAAVRDLGEEPRAREHADVLEFRMDLAAGDSLGALRKYKGDLPVIATNRARVEGGGASDDPGRIETLAQAAELPHVHFVDVELDWLRDGRASSVRAALGEETELIASVHDFDRMPPVERCQDLLRGACEEGDIGKLAVQATTRGEALRVLELTNWAEREGLRVATMAMGETGRHTRLVAPLYGSELTYAPLDTDASTAPGQYDLATLNALLERL
jgi:3-dehydroquinate dehydratase-1